MKIKLIEIENTLETDLYNNGYLSEHLELLTTHKKHDDIFVAKKNMKTEIAQVLIEDNINLANWHAIEDIENEFPSN